MKSCLPILLVLAAGCSQGADAGPSASPGSAAPATDENTQAGGQAQQPSSPAVTPNDQKPAETRPSAPLESDASAPAIYEQTVDASSTTATTYLKLVDGKLEVTTVDVGGWWIAAKRTQFQTNGGTSGTGTVGVYDSAQTDFTAVTSCAGLTFTADAMLPASGAPGSQPYSGSALLNAWYDYDFTTHVVSSKQHVYAVSDGNQCLKLQILTYANGSYSIKVSTL